MDITKQRSSIYKERINLLYKQMPTLLIADVGTIWTTGYSLWGNDKELAVILWVVFCTFLAFCFAVIVYAYQKIQDVGGDFKYPWDTAMIVLFGIAGSTWGVLPWIFLETISTTQFVIIMSVVMGVCAAIMPTLASLYKSYVVFSVPVMGLVAARLIIEDAHDYKVLSFLCVVFLLATLFFAKKIADSITNTLSLRYENLELVSELRKKKEEAELANREKSRFLAAASHDLRQPLHALGLFSSALNERLSDVDDLVLMNRISKSLNALDGLFGALLDISKLDAGIVEKNVVSFSLGKIVDEISSEFEPRLREIGVSLNKQNIDEYVLSDPILLGRILRNLLSNAARYTKIGSVSVSAEEDGQFVVISVADTGQGIPFNELENIFSEFHQLHNPERDRSKGLGLGLAIVRRLADLLSHSISVSSVLGKGSKFSIKIPKGEISDICIQKKAEASDESFSSIEGMSVLVIDDEVDILSGMKVLLDRWGCIPILAGDPYVALEEVGCGYVPDVIISDYRLREGMTGIEAVDIVCNKIGKKLPVLLITGDTAPERLKEARGSGYYLLHKPISPARLRAVLHKITAIAE